MSNKKTQKNNYKLIGGIVLLVVAICVVGITTVGKAQQKENGVAELTGLANALGNNADAFMAGLAYLRGDSPEEEGSFGGSTSDDWNVGGNLSVSGSNISNASSTVSGAYGIGLGTVGTDGSITDGYVEKVVVVDITNTSTASTINPEGETIWLCDATLRIQTATTTAISYKMGTSSTAVIGSDDLCGILGTCATATAAQASILNTEASAGVGAATTALDVFWKADYQGTDTRDASGTRFCVPVLSGEYLMVTASTTVANNVTTVGQAAQAQFKYFVIED